MKFICVLGLSVLILLPFGSVFASDIVDSDNDGLSDYEEINIYHTDPYKSDTDGDGFNDSEELMNGFSPLSATTTIISKLDTDNDGLSDALEIALRSDLTNPDTDGDGKKDGVTVKLGINPSTGKKDNTSIRTAEVDVAKQQLYYFLNGVKIGSIPVSTGIPGLDTPLGEFKILRKVPVVNYVGPGYNLPNTKWNLEFKRHFYLHGAYWHNQFGIRPMSHGCVNIAYINAEKLYQFFEAGDTVKVYGQTPKVKPLKTTKKVAVNPGT